MYVYVFIYNACFVGHISLPFQVLNVAVIVFSASINDNIGEDIHALLLAYNFFSFSRRKISEPSLITCGQMEMFL